ncbi:hypothetical protein TNCV_906951 [Trichonephila clavipes]|nr:hypothetical protein TNCV_906951 [Trichonephila clavipes]
MGDNSENDVKFSKITVEPLYGECSGLKYPKVMAYYYGTAHQNIINCSAVDWKHLRDFLGLVRSTARRKEICQSLRQVGLLHDRWRQHLSPFPQFRYGLEGMEIFSNTLHQLFLLRLPAGLSNPLILRSCIPCALEGYLVGSGIEPRPSGLESDVLTTRLPTAYN